ncbi:MAG: ferrochelatase [Rickettsiales bacterium]|nr:ferrochelatase [Rickettsiales bacterium]
MKNLNKKTAVILFNLGGPDSPQAVKPFLFNLFNDRAIISLPQPFRFFLAKLISSRREKKAQAIYAQIGGKSPLLELTQQQAYALEKELSFVGNFKVFIAMRYWKPLAEETVLEVKKYDPDQLILLPLYPQFSSATTESSVSDFVEKFAQKRKKSDKELKTKIVCCYPTESDFIKSHSLLIKQTILKSYADFPKFRFLFSAHGLPQKLIDAGDPYVFQVEETAQKIVKNLAEILSVKEEEINFKICFQSKVGPLQWTSPSLEQEIKRVALDKKIPVIIPVAFVSEHSETLVELDIEYKEMAEKLGIKNYLRVPALNADGHFIKSLATICKNVDLNNDFSVFSGGAPIRICPKKMRMCSNPNPCQA